MSKSVLVGISGGVDSAYCCKRLLEEGWEVTGAFLRFGDDASPNKARRIAKDLGIKLYESDRRRAFENKVINGFVNAYLSGKTPNPCVDCNREMKFKSLIELADKLGIEKVATGHYASVGFDPDTGRYYIEKAKDFFKDQSYFLWRLTQKQLSRIIFPLSSQEKADVKKKTSCLVPQEQKESMEICFIPDNDYAAFIEKRTSSLPLPDSARGGRFVDKNGNPLGTHNGIFRYTVGQRRGLSVSLGRRAFVTAINPETGDITLSYEEDSYIDSLYIKNINFVSETSLAPSDQSLCIKVRSRMTPVSCSVKLAGRSAYIRLKTPVRVVAPGQSAVIYRNDRVVLGGYVE